MNISPFRLILLGATLATAVLDAQERGTQAAPRHAGQVVQEPSQVVGQPSPDQKSTEGVEDKLRQGKNKRLAITPRQKNEKSQNSPIRFGPGQRTIKTVLGSLAVVLGAFFLLAWFLKRNRGTSQQVLPKDVIQVLGRAALAGRQQLQLVRVGGKLILLCVTPNSAETLTEITDPVEVERLAGACQVTQPNSISTSFRQVLEQFGKEPARGFLDTEAVTAADSTASRRPRDVSVEV